MNGPEHTHMIEMSVEELLGTSDVAYIRVLLFLCKLNYVLLCRRRTGKKHHLDLRIIVSSLFTSSVESMSFPPSAKANVPIYVPTPRHLGRQ
jgi:hypothetical protein